jgi:succinyl-CoA synthetase alpha subunit
MSILINTNTRLVIQGITGKEGQRSFEWIRAYNPNTVVAGVTPGKGGQILEGIPVYNSVQEAIQAHPDINASSIYAPPAFVLPAAREAIEAAIPLLHIIAEEIPLRDSVEIINLASQKGIRVVGPSSIGVISPGKTKLGSIGGPDNQQFKAGSVAIISKSGGMSSEIALLLTTNGYGQSTVVGIGGNVIVGTTYADLVPLLEEDVQTKAVIIIGEIGGSYEEDLAQTLQQFPNHKPYIAFISGRFAQTLPHGMSFGHAGAIVDQKVGTLNGKLRALHEADVVTVEEPSAIINVLSEKITRDF